MRLRGWAGPLMIAALLGGAPAAARAEGEVPAAELLAAVNAKRAANGVPPLELDERMSQGCREYLEYARLNLGSTEFHDETPGRPGYTELGQRAAQRSEGGGDLRLPDSPIYSAPAHREGFMNPIALKAGVAQATIGGFPTSCTWISIYEDADLKPAHRAPSSPPRGWSVPGDGQTGTWNYEVSSEGPTTPAFDVGFAKTTSELYLAGQHVFLYHDDLPSGSLYLACRGALLGPGGRPVQAPLLRGRILVPKEPFLPGGRYRTAATHSTATPCAATQRSTLTSFTTSGRTPDAELLRIGEPYQSGGRWYADSYADPLLRFGPGTITADYDNVHGRYRYDLKDWWRGGRPPEDLSSVFAGTYTLTLKSDGMTAGPVCWSPQSVSRTFTVARSGGADGPVTGVTAAPPVVTRPNPDPCAAPPVAAAPAPASGAPGTVVRIAGSGVDKATDVRFGGVAASAWDVDAGSLRVTVPAGARSGALTVRTPTGTTTSTATFKVAPVDAAAPDTWIDLAPRGAGEAATVHVAFSSTEGGGRSLCALDGRRAAPCTSPHAMEGLAAGVHRLDVTAVDAAGNPDPTPAGVAWRVGEGAAPPQPAAGVPRRPVVLALGTPRLQAGQLRFGTVAVLARTRVRATLRATVGGRRLALAPLVRTVADGATATLSVRLSRAARQRLRGVRRLRVTATITTQALPAGRPVTVRRSLVVRVG